MTKRSTAICLRKRILKGNVWSTTLYGCEALNLSNATQTNIEAAEMRFFPKRASHIMDKTCHKLNFSADSRSKRTDDAKHKAETNAITWLCDWRWLIGKCLCHRKNWRKKRERKTHAEVHGYLGDGSRGWRERGGEHSGGSWSTTSPGMSHFDNIR